MPGDNGRGWYDGYDDENREQHIDPVLKVWRDGPDPHKNKEDSSDSSCFVATAVYGDINAPEVQTLRDFRDNVMVNTSLGRKVVEFYYSGVGERTAEFIKKHTPSIVPVIKKGLDYIVQKYESNKKQID